TAQVRKLLADATLPAEQRCTLCYALAHVLDKQKSHDEAFAYYRQANDTKWEIFRTRGQGFDRAQHERFIEQTMAVGTAEFFRTKGDASLFPPPNDSQDIYRAGGKRDASPFSELPVFIVGMPRSGTTLVEQILASHPQVHGAGELPDIPNIGS